MHLCTIFVEGVESATCEMRAKLKSQVVQIVDQNGGKFESFKHITENFLTMFIGRRLESYEM